MSGEERNSARSQRPNARFSFAAADFRLLLGFFLNFALEPLGGDSTTDRSGGLPGVLGGKNPAVAMRKSFWIFGRTVDFAEGVCYD